MIEYIYLTSCEERLSMNHREFFLNRLMISKGERATPITQNIPIAFHAYTEHSRTCSGVTC